MFIAQIKPPSIILYPVVGLVESVQWSARRQAIQNCKGLWPHYLMPQPRLQGEKPHSERHRDATKPVELSKHLSGDNIRSRG